MVEHHDITIQYIKDIRSVIFLSNRILYRYMFKVSDSIKCGITIKATKIRAFTFHMNRMYEMVYNILHRAAVRYIKTLDRAIRKSTFSHTMVHADMTDRIYPNKRTTIIRTMIIGALHERALRIHIPYSHIHAHRCIEVSEDCSRDCFILK